MNINERQFQYLQTMGVSLWKSRSHFFQDNLPSDNTAKAKSSVASKGITGNDTTTNSKSVSKEHTKMHNFDSIEQFLTHPLSIDILLALNCDKSNASLTAEGVQLDTLLWQFKSDNRCNYHEQTLNTPSLENLAKDKRLKSELWVCLCSHLNN